MVGVLLLVDIVILTAWFIVNPMMVEREYLYEMVGVTMVNDRCTQTSVWLPTSPPFVIPASPLTKKCSPSCPPLNEGILQLTCHAVIVSYAVQWTTDTCRVHGNHSLSCNDFTGMVHFHYHWTLVWFLPFPQGPPLPRPFPVISSHCQGPGDSCIILRKQFVVTLLLWYVIISITLPLWDVIKSITLPCDMLLSQLPSHVICYYLNNSM